MWTAFGKFLPQVRSCVLVFFMLRDVVALEIKNLEKRPIDLYLKDIDLNNVVWRGESSDDENSEENFLQSNHNTDTERSIDDQNYDTSSFKYDEFWWQTTNQTSKFYWICKSHILLVKMAPNGFVKILLKMYVINKIIHTK